jgi:ribosomal protein S27AE
MIGLLIAITVIPWLALRAQNLMGDESRCSRCGTTGHDKNANYCYKCGEKEFSGDSD